MKRGWIIGATLAGSLLTLSLAFAGTERAIFDPTISLGVLIHLLTLVAGIFGAFYYAGRFIERQKREFLEKVQELHLDMTNKVGALSERLTVVESRTSDLWAWWREMRGRP